MKKKRNKGQGREVPGEDWGVPSYHDWVRRTITPRDGLNEDRLKNPHDEDEGDEFSR
jgi:hypothetical protein